MAEFFPSIIPSTGPFDTVAMQIAQARAQAIANHTNEEAFLEEIAKTNEDANANVLTGVQTPAADDILRDSLLELDPSLNPPLDPSEDPTADPTTLSLFTQFGETLKTEPSSDSVKSQQLHDLGILQKDAELLEEAANENQHVSLGTGATTVDLSLAAQAITEATAATSANSPASLTPVQLQQIGDILQPIANEPFTAAHLQQIQAELTATKNTVQLSLNTMLLAMNFIAGLQPNIHLVVEHAQPHDKKILVAPVSAIDKVAVEDSAIRR